MAGGFEYLDEGKKGGGINKKKLSNLQTDQDGMEESPAEGGEGYVGAETGAAVGFDYVTGKKGYSTTKSVWDQKTGDTSEPSRVAGGSSPSPAIQTAGSDSTDEKATYKKVSTDEGLPQTFESEPGRSSGGASGIADEVLGGEGEPKTSDNAQKIGSEMPQTMFTDEEGGGAPKFKHRG